MKNEKTSIVSHPTPLHHKFVSLITKYMKNTLSYRAKKNSPLLCVRCIYEFVMKVLYANYLISFVELIMSDAL